MLERDGPRKINDTVLTPGRVAWGLVLAVLASIWIIGAVNPSPNDNPKLFIALAICATAASGFCLFPSVSAKFWKSIGIGVAWLYRLIMAGLIIAAVVSIFAGAPIPAAIIVGALIIAAAITQSE